MSQGISGCFSNRHPVTTNKNDITQTKRNYSFAQECFAYFISKFKRSTDVHALLSLDEHTNKQTNELGINYKVSKCHFARLLSRASITPGLHGNPNSLHQYLLFCSAMISFHSGVHQNITICHLMKTNKNFAVDVCRIRTTIFLVFNIF